MNAGRSVAKRNPVTTVAAVCEKVCAHLCFGFAALDSGPCLVAKAQATNVV
jgi:hypothetical protein